MGLDPYAFERRLLGIGSYVSEAEARKNIGNFLSVVKRKSHQTEIRDDSANVEEMAYASDKETMDTPTTCRSDHTGE